MAGVSRLDKMPVFLIEVSRNIQLEEQIATLRRETRGIRKNFSYPGLKNDSSLHDIEGIYYQEFLNHFLNPDCKSWINTELRFIDLDLLEERVHDNTRFLRAIEDLRDTGTIYPISLDLDEENNSYLVVNGLHRIATCKLFGYRMIPAVVNFDCFYHPNNGFEKSFRIF